MIEKKETPLLIDAVDIVEICKRAGTVDSIDAAMTIKQAFDAVVRPKAEISQTSWLYYKLLGTIYDAGRIQGIREERAKHKAADFKAWKEAHSEKTAKHIPTTEKERQEIIAEIIANLDKLGRVEHKDKGATV